MFWISRRRNEAAPTKELTVSNAHSSPTVERWRKLSDTAIEVNLDAPVTPPHAGAVIQWQPVAGRGWVKVERIGKAIFVGGRKVIQHFEPGQLNGTLLGHELRERLKTEDTFDPRVLDALVEFEDGRLIPDSWKQNSLGRTLYLFAWAVGFRDRRGGGLCVRNLFWDSGQWRCHFSWLDVGWGVQHPALLLAS